MWGAARNSGRRRGNQAERPTPRLTNIVKTAVRIIAGSDTQEVPRAAKVIGLASRHFIGGGAQANMRQARGAEVLRVHELTGLPLEILLRIDGRYGQSGALGLLGAGEKREGKFTYCKYCTCCEWRPSDIDLTTTMHSISK